jgi:trigger factor
MAFEPQPAWGVDVSVTATAPVLPPVTLPDWSKIKVAPVVKEVSDAGVAKAIDSFRERFAAEAAVDRPAANGDLVELDYEVLVDGVAVEGGSGTGHKAIVGRGHLLPEIESILVGMKAGEEKRQPISFGPAHSLRVVAGKTGDCKIVLRQVFERQLPELNDEFAARLGPFKTVADLQAQIRADLEEGAKADGQQQTERACLEAAVAASQFGHLPEILVNDEVSRLVHELEHSVVRYGITFDDYLLHIKKSKQELRLDFTAPATQRLKVTLLLRAISREQNFATPDEEVSAEVARLKAQVEDPQRFDDPRIQAQIRADLVQKQAVAWVVKMVAV